MKLMVLYVLKLSFEVLWFLSWSVFLRWDRIYEAPRTRGLLSLFLQMYVYPVHSRVPATYSRLNDMLIKLIMFLLLNCKHLLMLPVKGYTQIMFKFSCLWSLIFCMWIFISFNFQVYGGNSSELSCLILEIPSLNQFDTQAKNKEILRLIVWSFCFQL